MGQVRRTHYFVGGHDEVEVDLDGDGDFDSLDDSDEDVLEDLDDEAIVGAGYDR